MVLLVCYKRLIMKSTDRVKIFFMMVDAVHH